MAKHRKSIWISPFSGIFLSALTGSVVSLTAVFLFSEFILIFMDDISAVGYFSNAALCGGGICGGFICGKFRRLNGLKEGLICGAVIYIILSVVTLIAAGQLMSIKRLLLISAFSAAGGVIGVNSKRPNNLRTDT